MDFDKYKTANSFKALYGDMYPKSKKLFLHL